MCVLRFKTLFLVNVRVDVFCFHNFTYRVCENKNNERISTSRPSSIAKDYAGYKTKSTKTE